MACASLEGFFGGTRIPFSPGRTDATDEMTDVESFGHLESTADGFRNYASPETDRPAEELLVDKAHLLTLTAPEMTVLVITSLLSW